MKINKFVTKINGFRHEHFVAISCPFYSSSLRHVENKNTNEFLWIIVIINFQSNRWFSPLFPFYFYFFFLSTCSIRFQQKQTNNLWRFFFVCSWNSFLFLSSRPMKYCWIKSLNDWRIWMLKMLLIRNLSVRFNYTNFNINC